MGVRYSGDSVNGAHFTRRDTKGFQVGQTRLPQGWAPKHPMGGIVTIFPFDSFRYASALELE